ncbi:MAG: T9SS type A sorting domain-containing protein [Balneola sp.]
MNSRVSSYLFIFLINVFLFSSTQAQFAGGDGSGGDPYQISTAAQLDSVRNHLGSSFILTANIDLNTSPYNTGSGWEPIGSNTSQFTGSFDGNGFTISNLFIDRSSTQYIGLFGFTSSTATLTNVALTSVDITGSTYTGGLLGLNNGTVIESYVKGSVTGGGIVGGLIGLSQGTGTISDCYTEVTVSGTGGVGGLVGNFNGGTMSTSYSLGSVTGGEGTGGLVGGNNSTILNSYSLASVSSNSSSGGLIGVNFGTITNTYSAGAVSDISASGGLTGSNGTDTNSYWNTETSGKSSSSDGSGLTNTEMKAEASFSGWDFTTIWNIDEGSSYPYLRTNTQSPSPFLDPLFAGGNGTKADPYQVNTPAHLNNMRFFTNKYFQQTAEIDIDANNPSSDYYNSGSGWSPIGSSSSAFSNYFDGNGYTISGLFINRSGTDNVGLIGYGSSDTLINIALIDVNITGNNVTGALIGRGTSSTYISGSYASGKVTGSDDVGGLVGLLDTGSKIDSSFSVTSVSGTTNIAGLIARTANGVTVTHTFAGGAVSGSNGVGGLVGSNGGALTSTGNYWDSDHSGQVSSVTGTGLTTAQMKTQSSFSGWDFTNTWGMAENFSYPYLKNNGSLRAGGPEISGDEGWRMFSASFNGLSYDSLLVGLWTQGFTGADGSTNGTSNVQIWNEGTRSFSSVSNATDIPSAGTGFIAYVFDDEDFDGSGDGFPKSLSIAGEDRSGTVSPTLSFTDTGNSIDDGWNLLGNPFISVIDWDAGSGWTKTNLNSSVYVWSDSASSGAGAYLSWNGATGTLSNGLIAPGQGFWAQANAASPSISLTDDVRSSSSDVFLKEKPVPEIRLNISDENFTSTAILMFSETANIDFDTQDAWKLQSLNGDYLSLFTQLEDGSGLDINAIPFDLEGELTIPLGFDGSDLSGDYTLNWNPHALPEDMAMVLVDTDTGTEVDLTEASSYRFEIGNKGKAQSVETQHLASQKSKSSPRHQVFSPKVMKAKAAAARFVIKINASTSVTNEPGSDLPSVVELDQNYPNPFNPSTTINFVVPEQANVQLVVFDMLGRKVAELLNEPKPPERYSINFDASQLASGLYLYRLQIGSSVLTKKMTLIK